MEPDLSTVSTRLEFSQALRQLVESSVRKGRIENAAHLAKKMQLSRAAVSAWLSARTPAKGTGLPAPAHLHRMLTLLGVDDQTGWMDARDRAEAAGVAPERAEEVAEPSPSRRWRLAAVAGLAITVLVAGSVLAWRVSGSPPDANASPASATPSIDGQPLYVTAMPSAASVVSTGYADCEPAGQVCLYTQENGRRGEMVDLGVVKPGQLFDLWRIPFSRPSRDHWGDAVTAARNNSSYVLCFFDDRDLAGPYYRFGGAWRGGEQAHFRYENSDKADVALIIAALPCPEQLPR